MRNKRKLRIESLEPRRVFAGWAGLHNNQLPTDVNQDGNTTALDALVIINGFVVNDDNEWEPQPKRYWRQLGYKPDVNKSRTVTSLDALLVLNRLSIIEAEAERVDAVFDNTSWLEDDDDKDWWEF